MANSAGCITGRMARGGCRHRAGAGDVTLANQAGIDRGGLLQYRLDTAEANDVPTVRNNHPGTINRMRTAIRAGTLNIKGNGGTLKHWG
jgi:hypothetical protein